MNMGETAISVVMSVYKEKYEWLQLSIDSILRQSFTDFEFLIVDDNPQDERLKKFLFNYQKKDSRIKIIVNELNIGLTKSLNVAIKQAQGFYIVRMDADDESLPYRFQVQHDYMQTHPNVAACGSNRRTFGNVSFFTQKVNPLLPCTNDEIKTNLLFSNPMMHPSMIMKRIVNGHLIRYDENTRIAQDYMLWFSMIKEGLEINNIDKVLINYRISDTQISSKSDYQKKVGKQIYRGIFVDLIPKFTERDIDIHFEICNYIHSGISLQEKIAHIEVIYTTLSKTVINLNFARKLCKDYAYMTCLIYNNLYAFSSCSFVNFKDILDLQYIKGCVKNLLNINK